MSSQGGAIEGSFVTVGIISIIIVAFLVIVAEDEPFYQEAMAPSKRRTDAFRENLESLTNAVAGLTPQPAPNATVPADLVIGGPAVFQIPGEFFASTANFNPFVVINGFLNFVANIFGLVINGTLGVALMSIGLFTVLAEVPLGIGLIFGTISAFIITYYLVNFLVFLVGSFKPF